MARSGRNDRPRYAFPIQNHGATASRGRSAKRVLVPKGRKTQNTPVSEKNARPSRRSIKRMGRREKKVNASARRNPRLCCFHPRAKVIFWLYSRYRPQTCGSYQTEPLYNAYSSLCIVRQYRTESSDFVLPQREYFCGPATVA